MKNWQFNLNYFPKSSWLFSIFLLLQIGAFAQPAYFSTDFESVPSGSSFTRPAWREEGFFTDAWDDFLNERTVVDTSYSVSGSKSLRIIYPKGGFGPRQTGAQVPVLLPPRDEYFVSYYVRFSENFSWGNTSQGGKLPGICAGKRCVNTGSGFVCDGTTGFYTLFMWREGGRAVLYMLNVDKKSDYGDDYGLVYPDGKNVVFEKGKWYQLIQRVKLNTGSDKYDGIVQVWIDGKQVLLLDKVRFVTNRDKIDTFLFVTFHGGGDKSWAPEETCFTWFDDIKISTKKEDVE
jgi:hypothetical protein